MNAGWIGVIKMMAGVEVLNVKEEISKVDTAKLNAKARGEISLRACLLHCTNQLVLGLYPRRMMQMLRNLAPPETFSKVLIAVLDELALGELEGHQSALAIACMPTSLDDYGTRFVVPCQPYQGRLRGAETAALQGHPGPAGVGGNALADTVCLPWALCVVHVHARRRRQRVGVVNCRLAHAVCGASDDR